MEIKTLSEVLGHKSATVTLNRYAHSMMEHKQNAMDKFGALLTK
jgi:integrase